MKAMDFLLLKPRAWSEESYKIGSVGPSFRLSVRFLELAYNFFSKTWHGVRGPYIVVCGSWIGQKRPKIVKKAQKQGFWTF